MELNFYTLTGAIIGSFTIITIIAWFVAGHLDRKLGTENWRCCRCKHTCCSAPKNNTEIQER